MMSTKNNKSIVAPYFQVDAFITGSPFSGNPAGVCLLDYWPEDLLLQSMAAEHNLAETAFLVENGERFNLRWFTPTVEIDLCGHATLASAHVLFNQCPDKKELRFMTQSGELRVSRDLSGESNAERNRLVLDFPINHLEQVVYGDEYETFSQQIYTAVGHSPKEVWKSNFLVAVFEDEKIIETLSPNFEAITLLNLFSLIVTAASTMKGVDFVSRFFAPQIGIPEDPVTGAAHCALTPLWIEKLGKKQLHAIQLSHRRGSLHCWVEGVRVFLSGEAKTYMSGTIRV